MAKPKLGHDTTPGSTAKMEVRVPRELRDEAELWMFDDENTSSFVRTAMVLLINQRKRAYARRYTHLHLKGSKR